MKKLTLSAMLAAISICIFSIEAYIPPPVSLPGIKCGLSNVITLIALFLLGGREALLILFIRIILTSLFFTSGLSLAYSLIGGISAFLIMLLLKPLLKDCIWVLSVFGALAHNFGQIVTAAFLMHTAAIYSYLPILIISAVITGTFTGIAAQTAILKSKHLKKLFDEVKK